VVGHLQVAWTLESDDPVSGFPGLSTMILTGLLHLLSHSKAPTTDNVWPTYTLMQQTYVPKTWYKTHIILEPIVTDPTTVKDTIAPSVDKPTVISRPFTIRPISLKQPRNATKYSQLTCNNPSLAKHPGTRIV